MLWVAVRLIVIAAVVAGTGSVALAQPQPCPTAMAEARANRLARAHLEFELCRKAGALSPATERQRKQVRDRLRGGDFAPVAFVLSPAGAVLRMPDFVPDRTLDTDLDIWLPFGSHRYQVSAPGHQPVERTLDIADGNRQLIRVELEPIAGPEATDVDFGEDGPAVEQPIVSPDLQPKKHKSLIPDRFRLNEHGHVVRSEPARRDLRWPCAIGWM